MSPAEFYLLARRAADTGDEELWRQVAQGLDNLAAGLDASKAEIARLRDVIRTAKDALRGHDPEQPYMKAIRAALKPDTGETK